MSFPTTIHLHCSKDIENISSPKYIFHKLDSEDMDFGEDHSNYWSRIIKIPE